MPRLADEGLGDRQSLVSYVDLHAVLRRGGKFNAHRHDAKPDPLKADDALKPVKLGAHHGRGRQHPPQDGLGDQELPPLGGVVKHLSPRHALLDGGVHVVDLQAVQRDHLRQHPAGIVGNLQRAGHVDGLEVPNQSRARRKVAVAFLDPRLSAPHPAAERRVRYPGVLPFGEKVPSVLIGASAGAHPCPDVVGRGHLLAVLDAGHLGLCPVIGVGELLAGQARLRAQDAQTGRQSFRLCEPFLE